MTNQEAIREFESLLKWASLNRYPYVSKQRVEAVKMAIKALEQESDWIPVSERLPEIVEFYLTSIKWADGTASVKISWFDGISFKAEVKAWMSLPKPYTTESEG